MKLTGLIARVGVALTFVTAAAGIARAQGGVPGAPTNLQTSYSGGILTLTWSAPATTGVTGSPTSYVIRAGYLPALLDLAEVDTGSLATTFSVFVPPGFPPPDTSGRTINSGGQMFLAVFARNAAGLSAQSNGVFVDTRGGGSPPGTCALPPGAPAGVAAIVIGAQVTINWGPGGGCAATGFVLHAGTSPGASNAAIANVGLTQTLSASAPAGTYYVRVFAQNAAGVSPASNEVTVVVGGAASPIGPSGDPLAEGIALYNQGRYAEARTYFSRVTRNVDRNGEASYWRGLIEIQIGTRSVAIAYLSGYLRLHPNGRYSAIVRELLSRL